MPGEVRRGHETESIGIAEFGEDAFQFGRDIFRIAEPVPALSNTDRSDLSSPGVYVLEEMAMEFEVVVQIEAAIRRRFFRPYDEECHLCFIKQSRVRDIKQVL